LAYFALLAESAGHPLDLERLDSNTFLQAVIDSFRGDETALAQLIRRLT
jgi:cell filamentation protein